MIFEFSFEDCRQFLGSVLCSLNWCYYEMSQFLAQQLQRYREYANIYKEEEEERSERWKDFLERETGSAQLAINGFSADKCFMAVHTEVEKEESDLNLQKDVQGDDLSGFDVSREDVCSNVSTGGVADTVGMPPEAGKKTCESQIWTEIRPSLHAIETMASARVKVILLKTEHNTGIGKPLPPIEEARSIKGAPDDESEEEFYDVERYDMSHDVRSSDTLSAPVTDAVSDTTPLQSSFPWKEELECLVQGGVPMALRGEIWQAFVGVKARRVEKYYQDLLAQDTTSGNNVDNQSLEPEKGAKTTTNTLCVPEKWKVQIEKDLPRTFPGHPALDEDGRNALRRLLTAYALHNPSVGYCQDINQREFICWTQFAPKR